jgi:predicted DNA-binding protein (UPF0251 family)
MRPKKTRSVKCMPGERCFRPRCKSLKGLEAVNLSIDEFEAIRLSDLEQLYHVQAAKLMRVSRPTFTRILACAHGKIADALINIKNILIEGGCCTVRNKK